MRLYYMKPIHSLIILTLTAVLLSGGCDTLRKIAGRPVSSEIEAARKALDETKSNAWKADSLSIAAAENARRDSAATRLLDSLKVNVIHSSTMGGVISGSGVQAYHVVVGSFRNLANADNLLEKVQASGYPALILKLGNGYSAVSLCPSARISDVADAYVRISGESFCPKGAWILKNCDETL